MDRFVRLLLLATLALPYVRSPLCEADAHAHDHGGMMAAFDAPDHHGAGEDCHALMGCQVMTVASFATAEDARRTGPTADDGSAAADRQPLAPAQAPRPPPPKSV